VLEHGRLVADIPNFALTDDAPLYNRSVVPWKAPVPSSKPNHIFFRGVADFTRDLKLLLSAPNVCSKRWIFQQYDSMVQTNTVEGPGADAGVMRIKGSKRALAMALDGNSRWCWLDPKLGAMHAVAEAARNVSCTGATPVAATNCLNFGNPEKPEIMGQFSETIDGLAAACEALETPITGGNVSLYNETLGESIYPTPVVGVVGILDNIEDRMTFHFRQAGREIFLISPRSTSDAACQEVCFGSSEYAKEILGEVWGSPPPLDLKQEMAVEKCLRELIHNHDIESAHDCSEGGLAVALAECAFPAGIGAELDLHSAAPSLEVALFGEDAGSTLVTCDLEKAQSIKQTAVKWGLEAERLGQTIPAMLVIRIDGRMAVSASVSELREVWDTALDRALHLETPEHVVPETLEKG
jgi:phosphoribosylformylglycinamidine synthase